MAELAPHTARLLADDHVEGSLEPQQWLDDFASVDAVNTERKGFRKMLARKRKLPEPVEELVAPLLALLREDVEGQPVNLRIDLRRPDATKQDLPAQPPLVKLQERASTAQWLAGGVQLADGANLQFTITEHERELTRHKRSPGGRIKVKKTLKRRSQIDVWLALPSDTYALSDAAQDASIKVKVKVKEDSKRDKVHVKRVVKARDDRSPLALEELTTALGEAYAQARRRA